MLDERLDLAVLRHRDEGVLDLTGLLVGMLGLEAGRAVGVSACQLADRAVERGGKEHRLAVARQPAHDAVDLRLEAHVEHPVGLVEDERANVREIDEPAVRQVFEPSGRGHEDVSPLGALGLSVQRHAAVDRGHGQLLGRGKRLKLGGDLRRELARRNEHEGGRPGVGRHRSLDDRHGEGEGLAGPGRRLREHVDARECVRKDESLDRERLVDRAS